MTLLEKAKELGVDILSDETGEWGSGCPCSNGLETDKKSFDFCPGHTCVQCYAREYREPEQTAEDKKAMPDYWASISAINERQTAKGLSKYGQPLEENITLTATQRIEHAQEEAIDLLKYLEHLKCIMTGELTANDYHRAAMRTGGDYENQLDMIRNAAYGMCGESGEIIDLLKKHEFQGHPLDRDKILEETGDVLWYIALMAEAWGTTLQDIMERNIEKLKERYPDGFDKNRSINRKE